MISVLVPVYNVEKYIRECLDSILAQTYSDFELILVDDGSTDDSGRICDEYGMKDDRIRVFHKENGGPSSARNMCLDKAKGEYLCFVDSDDIIRKDYLEKLMGAIKADESDLAVCDMDEEGLSDEPSKENISTGISKETFRNWLYDDRTKQYVLLIVPWGKIYAKELFEDIRYPLGKLHEDEYVVGPILERCSAVSFVPEKLYYYRQNDSGVTSSANSMNLKHLDVVEALTRRIEMALREGDSSFALATLKNALYKCAGFYREAKRLDAEEMKKASMARYKETYAEYGKMLSFKQRLKYSLFPVCPSAFIRLYNP